MKFLILVVTILSVNAFANETAFRCQAFAVYSRVPKATSGVFTPWVSAATEDLAREAAIDRCTDYGTGCSINKCESYTKTAAVNYSRKCLSLGMKQLPRNTIATYFPGYGNDDETAQANALKSCEGQASGCRSMKCYDNN